MDTNRPENLEEYEYVHKQTALILEEIRAVLQEGRLPDLDLLSQFLDATGYLHELYIQFREEMGIEKNLSLPELRKRANEFYGLKWRTEALRGELQEFLRVGSDDEAFDIAVEPLRRQASKLLAGLDAGADEASLAAMEESSGMLRLALRLVKLPDDDKAGSELYDLRPPYLLWKGLANGKYRITEETAPDADQASETAAEAAAAVTVEEAADGVADASQLSASSDGKKGETVAGTAAPAAAAAPAASESPGDGEAPGPEKLPESVKKAGPGMAEPAGTQKETPGADARPVKPRKAVQDTFDIMLTVQYLSAYNGMPIAPERKLPCVRGRNEVRPDPSAVPEGYVLVSKDLHVVNIRDRDEAPRPVAFLYRKTGSGEEAPKFPYELASWLLEQGYTPGEHSDFFENLISGLVAEGADKADGDLVDNSFVRAAVLAKGSALAKGGKDAGARFCLLHRALSMALGLPDMRGAYTGERLEALVADCGERYPEYCACALMFALACPADGGAKVKDAADAFRYGTAFGRLPQETRRAFDALAQAHGGGLLDCLCLGPEASANGSAGAEGSGEQTEARRKKLVQDAASLIGVPRISPPMNALTEMLSLCFGQGSALGVALRAIPTGKDPDAVARAIRLFSSRDGSGISAEAVEEYVDARWEEAKNEYLKRKKHGSVAPMVEYKVRDKIVSHIQKRWELLKEWADIASLSRADSTGSRQKLRQSELSGQLEKAVSELADAAETPGAAALRRALSRVGRAVRLGQPLFERREYAELLRAGLIPLGDDYLPLDMGELDASVPGFELWRRALMHVAAPVVPLRETLKAVETRGSPCADNLGAAALICRYIGDESKDYLAGAPYARNEAEQTVAELVGRAGLAEFYGEFSPSDKEEFERCLDSAAVFYCRSEYGLLRLFLSALDKQLPPGAVPEESGEGMEAPPPLSGFIDFSAKALDGPLSKAGRGALYGGEALRLAQSIGKTADDKEARALLSAARDAYDATQSRIEDDRLVPLFRTLFHQLGFGYLKSVVRKNKNRLEYFDLYDIERPERSAREYQHPISAFGTQTPERLPCVVLNAYKRPEDVVDMLTKANAYGFAAPVVVMMNCAFPIEDRRTMARAFKQNRNHAVLVIDHLLLLYLAGHSRDARLPALLACALPFCWYQPFNDSGRGDPPDEMFFGRVEEIKRIEAMPGAKLVYGGRMVGKSTVLHRAAVLGNRPQSGEYAILVADARSADPGGVSAGVLRQVADDLIKSKALSAKPKSWKELCGKLADRLEDGSVKRLLLLIDESDSFLEEEAGREFGSIKVLNELSVRYPGKFKFVLAGLHNVARLSHPGEPNSFIEQLGDPLCIRPMAPRAAGKDVNPDAKELLMRPLRCLGFHTPGPLQLSRMMEKTCYYPGILQLLGYLLVEQANRQACSGKAGCPPVVLNEELLISGIRDQEINKRVLDMLDKTIRVSNRYRTVAYILAIETYDTAGKPGAGSFTVSDMKDFLDYWKQEGMPPFLQGYDTENNLKILLEEMESMAILTSTPGSGSGRQYRINRWKDMQKVLGSREKVESELKVLLRGGAAQVSA